VVDVGPGRAPRLRRDSLPAASAHDAIPRQLGELLWRRRSSEGRRQTRLDAGGVRSSAAACATGFTPRSAV